MKPLAKEWLNKAYEDYCVAERELNADPPAFSAVCFHAQQAVEKTMKAILVESSIPFPRTHDLKFLLYLIKPETGAFDELEGELIALSVSALEVRYPGSKPDLKRAEEAFATAKTFFSIFDREFRDRYGP